MSGSVQGISPEASVGVVGAGAMGAGIAQIAAVAGHRVVLHDTRGGAAESAISGIRATLGKLADKGKIRPETAQAASANLVPAGDLRDLKGCALVVEAILENLDAKRGLFGQLEAILADEAILATNTSSISITAIGATLRRPERLAGMHFFNPAPQMSLVEVVSGAATTPATAESVFFTAERWGKTPVHARSTPGFIVNRVARPYYAEGLRLLQEGAADASTLDAVMRDCGGFRMGPFELMDLIGHDVNYAVTRSVFDAYYGDPRFQPSLLQLELVNAGFLGRKSGRGFYDYRDDAARPEPVSEALRSTPERMEVDCSSPIGAQLAQRLKTAACPFSEMLQPHEDGRLAAANGAALYLTDGRSATERAATSGIAATVVMDLMLDGMTAKRAAVARAEQCGEPGWNAIVGLLQAAGLAVSRLNDLPGLAVMRTVAMLANEACDAVHQQVCNPAAVDVAMRGGVGYPLGPLEWAERIGPRRVLEVLDNLARCYGEPRYRASPLLRQRLWGSRGLHG